MKARMPLRAAAIRAADMPRGGVAEALDAGVIDRLPSCAVGTSCLEKHVLKRQTHAKMYSKAVFLHPFLDGVARGASVACVKRRSVWRS